MPDPMQTEGLQTDNAGNGIFRAPEGWDFSVSIGDRCLIFLLPMTFKFVSYHSSFLSFLTFYVAKRPFPGVSRFFRCGECDVTYEI